MSWLIFACLCAASESLCFQSKIILYTHKFKSVAISWAQIIMPQTLSLRASVLVCWAENCCWFYESGVGFWEYWIPYSRVGNVLLHVCSNHNVLMGSIRTERQWKQGPRSLRIWSSSSWRERAVWRRKGRLSASSSFRRRQSTTAAWPRGRWGHPGRLTGTTCKPVKQYNSSCGSILLSCEFFFWAFETSQMKKKKMQIRSISFYCFLLVFRLSKV